MKTELTRVFKSDYEEVSYFQMASDRYRQMCGVRGGYLDDCMCASNKMQVRTN